MIDAHRLTPEEQQTLNGMSREMAVIENTIKGLEAAGIDCTEQRERLERAKLIRSGLLQHFGNPTVPR